MLRKRGAGGARTIVLVLILTWAHDRENDAGGQKGHLRLGSIPFPPVSLWRRKKTSGGRKSKSKRERPSRLIQSKKEGKSRRLKNILLHDILRRACA